MELYFSDRFFSTGVTDIMDETGHSVGSMDLESMLTSTLSIYGPDSKPRYSGRFRFLSTGWEVWDEAGQEIGFLRARFSMFSKRYEYDAGHRGVYEIEAPAFSHDYDILDERELTVATFQRVSNWLQAGAFKLMNHSDRLDDYELIAVIMGVHSMQKRNRNHA